MLSEMIRCSIAVIITCRKNMQWEIHPTTYETSSQDPDMGIHDSMSVQETAGLYFLPIGISANVAKHVKLLMGKLELHMNMHQCNCFYAN